MKLYCECISHRSESYFLFSTLVYFSFSIYVHVSVARPPPDDLLLSVSFSSSQSTVQYVSHPSTRLTPALLLCGHTWHRLSEQVSSPPLSKSEGGEDWNALYMNYRLADSTAHGTHFTVMSL